MASLSLPAPTRTVAPAPRSRPVVATTRTLALSGASNNNNNNNYNSSSNSSSSSSSKAVVPPSYEERCKTASIASKLTPDQRRAQKIKLFVPRSLGDFNDGGAYPEIHVAQYPRHMGNPHLNKSRTSSSNNAKGNSNNIVGGQQSISSKAIVNVEIDEKGEVSYDAIVKGGTNTNKIVYTKHEDLRGLGEAKAEDVALPTEEEESNTAQRTSDALNALLKNKIALNKPTGSAIINAETSKNHEEKTQFIKYTPNENTPGYNPAAAKRVIQMVPAQVDPMMPPKHKHIKAPSGPAEDPVPVLHAPPTKLSKEEREAWNIPACISNWKNTRGYTIPLDKRLAADGRGLRENTINPNFATVSESLYVAERQARQEVRMRAQVQKRLVMQEKEQREEQLRKLANQARLDRGGGGGGGNRNDEEQNDGQNEEVNSKLANGALNAIPDGSDSDDDSDNGNNNNNKNKQEETDDDVAARQRERLRIERKREREKELRMQNNMEIKKQRLESERDVSEKIALGTHTGSGGAGLGGQVDSRLYNQSAGMDSGFGADDEYNTYSKPLFGATGGSTGSIYRPTRGETEHNADEQYDKLVKGSTSKFQPDKGFAGADGGGPSSGSAAGPRSAPVQFEKGEGKK